MEAPVAFHSTMQVLSDFVEDRDADFSSCDVSHDRSSRPTTSRTGQDCASVASSSTFQPFGLKSDEEMSPFENVLPFKEAFHL